MLVPIRALGKYGVNTDVDPFSLPAETFTMAVNARFHDGRIDRAPMFKLVAPLSSPTGSVTPRFTATFLDNNAYPHVLIADDDGTIVDWSPRGSSDAYVIPATPTTIIPGYSKDPWTGCMFNNVVYLNRPDQTPLYRASFGGNFAQMPNGWDPTWRCAALRTCAGAVVAINVTKGGFNYPTMVKTSDYSTFGSPPNAWVGAPTNSASENILSMISEPLIDGWPLRDGLALYTAHQTVLMEPTYSSNIFAYKLLFKTRGVINQNCVADVDTLHYVFGADDIWAHDGYTPKTLAGGRVRRFVYQNMVNSQRKQFFVAHNPRLEEVMFCYISNDPNCTFLPVVNGKYPGCNRAAVYNYRSDTWQFYDLPYVTHGSVGSLMVGTSYDDQVLTPFSTVSGTFSDYIDTEKLAFLTVGAYVTSPRGDILPWVRCMELFDSTTSLGIPDSVATPDVFLEKTYIDLDQVSTEIRGYKVVRSIYPQGRMSDPTVPITFAFGSSDYANSPAPQYGPGMTFDGGAAYKLDYMTSGRWLSLRASFSSVTASFSLSGLDLELKVTGHR